MEAHWPPVPLAVNANRPCCLWLDFFAYLVLQKASINLSTMQKGPGMTDNGNEG
jgi:hypothetical protein